jgi:outer membrane protein TolC
MRFTPFGAVPCLLMVQAAAQTPLTFQDIQAKAWPAPEQWRAEALLAERSLQLQESRGFLREGPTVALSAGPRRTVGLPTATDRAFEVDVPLFLSPRLRTGLEAALGAAHPFLKEAARREGSLRLRAAYLEAWVTTRTLALRETDLEIVDRWLKTVRARFEAGADPAFQVSLVQGERLQAQQDLDEARIRQARAWGALAALADLPRSPLPLADPGPAQRLPEGDLAQNLGQEPLRKALQAQAELEVRSLRLKEAQALSRWSLRGSHAQEGEEQVTRFGVAVRLPRPGENSALHRSMEAQLQAVRGETRQALAELDARAQAALTRKISILSDEQPPDFTQAVAAVGLRLLEGRERPSEALPIRRQLLEAQLASLRRLQTQHLLTAELQTLFEVPR